MNERIKELMVQVCKEQGLPFTVEHNRAYMLDNFSEKFAELLVKECIQASEAHAKDLESQPTDPLLEAYEDGVVNGIYEATAAIKKHFGVEE